MNASFLSHGCCCYCRMTDSIAWGARVSTCVSLGFWVGVYTSGTTLKPRCDSCQHNLLTGWVRLWGGEGSIYMFPKYVLIEQWPCTQQWLAQRHTTMKYSFYQLYWCVKAHNCTQFQTYILICMKDSLPLGERVCDCSSLCPCLCWIWPLPCSCIPTNHSIAQDIVNHADLVLLTLVIGLHVQYNYTSVFPLPMQLKMHILLYIYTAAACYHINTQ